MSKQETIADIIEEMRRGTRLPGYWRSCDVNEILQYHADRLEAAWKREKTAIEADALAVGGMVEAARTTAEKSSVVGDAAKLREALGKLRAELWNNTVIAGKRKFKLYEIADAALAAPPRNCDKYSHAEALRIWSAEPASPMNGCFDVWLYAPAAEQEGGVK